MLPGELPEARYSLGRAVELETSISPTPRRRPSLSGRRCYSCAADRGLWEAAI